MRLNKGRPAGQGLMMLVVVLALLSSSINMVWAMPKEAVPQNNKVADWQCLQKNNFFMGITNNGSLGQDAGGGNAYGFWPAPALDINGEIPPGTGMNYIFGWGLWIGAQVKSTKPGKTRDTLCTFGYNPNNGAWEFTAGEVVDGVPQSEASPAARIYMSDRDWSLKTTSGQDSVVSMMDTRCVYNDYDVLQHATGGRPLKVQVTQTTYQWNYPTNQDIIFFLFEVKNTGTDTLFDVYLAPTADCDIGNESGTAANDVCYFDETTNMAYQYQTSAKEAGWSRDAGCVGFMFLESPIANKYFKAPDGSAFEINIGDTIGLFAFKVFNINIDPPGNIEQYKELAGYNYQTGFWSRKDQKPAAGDQRFMESTGPIDLLPDSTVRTIVAVIAANFNYKKGIADTVAIADLRSKAKTAKLIYDANWLLPGPPPAPKLTITPGHKRVIVGWDPLLETSADPTINRNMRYWNEVASDSATLAKFDPNFSAFIHQGYKLYKSKDGVKYELLAQWDKDDRYIVDSTGITVVGPETLKTAVWNIVDSCYNTVVNTWIATGKDSTFNWPDPSFVTDTRGSNSGQNYSYVDEDLINGMTYYYAVRAYGINWQSILDTAKANIIDKSPTYYETSISENATPAVPRSEPSEYVAPEAWVSSYGGNSYNLGQKISISVDLPRAVKKKSYRQEWGQVTRSPDLDTTTALQYAPVLKYRVKDLDYIDSVAVPWTTSTMAYDTVRGEVRFVKTVQYSPGNHITLINNILVNTGSFVVNSITPSPNYIDTATAAIITNPDMRWGFRSGTFQISWTVTGTFPNDTLWPQVSFVVDSAKNIVIPVPYDSTKLTDCINSSWNLGGTSTRVGRRYMTQDTTKITLPTNPNPSPLLTRQYMNVCGTRIYFRSPVGTTTRVMVWANKPATGDVWRLSTSGINIPVEGEYQVINTSEYQFATSVADLNKITVVPNPYIARNIWERTNDRNKLQFINLPTKCKIKIYTLAGNLIKVLEHDDNSGLAGGTCWWDPMLTMNQQQIASGVYLYYVDAPGIGTHVGKFAVVR